MTDEPKRRSYAVDDVDEIARHIKRIKDEEQAARDDLPCDTEPSALCEQAVNRRATLVKQEDGTWRWVGKEIASIYSDAYWQPLIDAGILSMVEPGDA